MAAITNNNSTTTAEAPIKLIAGADSFGQSLKDALITHLKNTNKDIEIQDLSTTSYYNIGAQVGHLVSTSTSSHTKTLGLLVCGTGVGVAIFANKFPGVFAATCLSPSEALNARSISNCNVLALSGMKTSPDEGIEILNTWLNTPFKSPCPASENKPWPDDLQEFFDNSMTEMPSIGSDKGKLEKTRAGSEECALCSLVKNRELTPIDLIPGGAMKIVRETPTSAFVRFKAGSVEPAHHHTFGHDLVVREGRKRVWNLTKNEVYDLEVGDFLYTPAGDVHRVAYYEDTEFFIKWDGHWDLFFDEDFDAARKAAFPDKEESK